MTSEDVKNILHRNGDTIEVAAKKLDMSLQNFYKHLRSDKLSKVFILKFKEVYSDTSNMVSEPGIPYYAIDVSASNVDVFNDQKEIASMHISVPGFEDCELALPVFGHSMYPTYENGCIIICKRIRDLEVIHYGEVHLIITSEQRLLKRIKKSTEKNCILLVSDNYEAQKENKLRYEPFDLSKSKIKHLYIVKGSIKRNQI